MTRLPPCLNADDEMTTCLWWALTYNLSRGERLFPDMYVRCVEFFHGERIVLGHFYRGLTLSSLVDDFDSLGLGLAAKWKA